VAARLARSMRSALLMDALYLGIAVVFFVVSWAFVEACDRLS
jgi:hypothetical protein